MKWPLEWLILTVLCEFLSGVFAKIDFAKIDQMSLIVGLLTPSRVASINWESCGYLKHSGALRMGRSVQPGEESKTFR